MVQYEAGEKVGDKGYLVLRGSFVGDVSDRELAASIEHHYVDDGVRRIVVDLRDVDEITLEAVAILLQLYRHSERRGKRFLIEDPTEPVKEKLRTTGVLDLLTGG